ncbi:YczE/YyaS/YitT family protein [Corynebacterium sp. A21]|uniref:YczE/YyaS/YitT family protein n=1 Tax=Corynebacterium sp. A21 TaxID=3457318 RepID=UPI003FD6AAEE
MPADETSMDPAQRYSTSTRWVLFFLGVWVMTVGIALTVHAELGTTPISTVPAAIAAATPLSFGVITILLSLVFILAQVLILRRRFALFQFWQLLVAFIFGALCDLSLAMTSFIQPGNYLLQWVVVILGAVLVSVGVFLQILPRILYAPGEGIVVAIALASGWRFGTVKQCFDWSLVVIAIIISLMFVGELAGVREGTVFAAFAVGGLTKVYQRVYDAGLRRRRFL